MDARPQAYRPNRSSIESTPVSRGALVSANAKQVASKVILSTPGTEPTSLVLVNLIAVAVGTAVLLLRVTVIGMMFFGVFIASMIKAANRHKGRSW